MVADGHPPAAGRLPDPLEEVVPGCPALLFDGPAGTAGPCGDVDLLDGGRQTEPLRPGGDEPGVRGGFGAQPVIQVSHVEVQVPGRLDPPQEVQQDDGVEAARDGDDDPVAAGDPCIAKGPGQDGLEALGRSAGWHGRSSGGRRPRPSVEHSPG